MRIPYLARTLALIACLPLASTACGGGGFEPSSKISGLRILALKKEPPYAKEDQTVGLELLYWDGKAKEGAPRDVKFNFFRCVNPPGDLYYNCFGSSLGFPGVGFTDAGAESSFVVDAASLPDASDDAMAGDDAMVAGDTMSADDAMTSDGATPIADAMAPNDATFPDDVMPGSDAMPGEGGAEPPPSDSIVTTRVVIPPGIVREKVAGVTPYGLVYVLFTACAGRLGFVKPTSAAALPIACFDADDRPLGPDDFVPGYSSIYVYKDLENKNPEVTDFLFRGSSFNASFTAPDADVPHVERCTKSERGDCPDLDVKLEVDPVSAERDSEAKDANGNPLLEQLWVAYHSTDGDFQSSLRLVNDATSGWNPDHGAKFRAPPTPGPVRLFAVVHDNRGGVRWARGKVIVD